MPILIIIDEFSQEKNQQVDVADQAEAEAQMRRFMTPTDKLNDYRCGLSRMFEIVAKDGRAYDVFGIMRANRHDLDEGELISSPSGRKLC